MAKEAPTSRERGRKRKLIPETQSKSTDFYPKRSRGAHSANTESTKARNQHQINSLLTSANTARFTTDENTAAGITALAKLNDDKPRTLISAKDSFGGTSIVGHEFAVNRSDEFQGQFSTTQPNKNYNTKPRTNDSFETPVAHTQSPRQEELTQKSTLADISNSWRLPAATMPSSSLESTLSGSSSEYIDINSFPECNNNCVYTSVAGLLNVTVQELLNKTEEMQHKDGKKISQSCYSISNLGIELYRKRAIHFSIKEYGIQSMGYCVSTTFFQTLQTCRS